MRPKLKCDLRTDVQNDGVREKASYKDAWLKHVDCMNKAYQLKLKNEKKNIRALSWNGIGYTYPKKLIENLKV